MFRPSWKYSVVAAALLGMLAMGASQAEACWWWGCYRPVCGCCTYYTPCYTVSCDPCCTGGWYLGCRPGPVRRLLFGPYRWYYTCWDVACCDIQPAAEPTTAPTEAPPRTPTVAPPQVPTEVRPEVSLEPDVDMPIQTGPAGTRPEAPVPTLPEQPPVPKATLPGPNALDASAGSGLISISVPAEARVTINGLLTSSTGARRQYVSYGLKPGFTYKYEIHAQMVRDGRLIEDQRTVYLTAGARQSVAFGFEPKPDEAVATLW